MLTRETLAKIAKTILPLFIGVLFIYLSVKNTSAQDRAAIYQSIKDAHYGYIFLSLILGLLSHLSRAIRWNFMLNPLGYYPRLINNILAIFITYIANLGVPRSGEIFRASVLQTYEGIPFEKSFGTIIAERAVDVLMLLITIGIAFVLEFDLIYSLLNNRIGNPSIIVLVVVGGIGIGVVIIRQLKKASHPFFRKIVSLINGITDGFLTIVRMKKKWAYLFHTFFIWAMYIAMFYIIKFSIPETQELAFEALLIGFIVGALAITATNGGIGIYPFSVSLVLISYGITKEASLAFGWIMWTAQTVMVIFFGSLSFFLLPFVNRKK